MNFISDSLKTCEIPRGLPHHLEIAETSDPFEVFGRWFEDACKQITEPNAMALATSHDGSPGNRIVYLRSWDEQGFVFFTNFQSDKGRSIAQNDRVEALFFWKEVWRQVRIHGHVQEVESALSDEYFAQRGRESQLGAWASMQSQPMDEEGSFDERLEFYRAKFKGQDVPRPSYWGGLRILPESFEFWQGRPARHHERWVFRRSEDLAGWCFLRLFP